MYHCAGITSSQVHVQSIEKHACVENYQSQNYSVLLILGRGSDATLKRVGSMNFSFLFTYNNYSSLNVSSLFDRNKR